MQAIQGRLWLVVMALFCFASTQAQAATDPYSTPLRQQDEENIRYIINTLANSSYFGLLSKQGSLERAGKAVDHVHPMRFVAFIFSDPQLRNNVRRISGIPWGRFVNDMGNSLSKASQSGAIDENVIDNFASTVQVDKNWVDGMVRAQNWQGLMNGLRSGAGSVAQTSQPYRY